MALFRYVAVTDSGRRAKGVIDADSYLLAEERLRRDQVMVIELTSIDEKKKEIKADFSLLFAFTKEFGTLLRAGLPVYESLITLEEKYRKHKAHALFLDLCDRLKNGSSLSSALKNYPKTFDRIYLAMITAAEESGNLTEVFEQLAELIGRQHKLKKKVISALIYPAFLGAFCIVVVLSLLLFVVPSMRELFEGRALHPLTEIVLSLSQFTIDWGMTILTLLISGSIALYLFFRKPQGKALLQTLYLRLPIFKTLIVQTALIRFCRALSALLLGGVPLIEALRLSSEVMKQSLLEETIRNAQKGISEGKKLSEELKKSPLIPPLVTRMLAIAEETGRTVPMLQNIAHIYDEEVENHLTQMTTLLQPLLLLFLGGMVGIILLSILLPLTDASSFLSN